MIVNFLAGIEGVIEGPFICIRAGDRRYGTVCSVINGRTFPFGPLRKTIVGSERSLELEPVRYRPFSKDIWGHPEFCPETLEIRNPTGRGCTCGRISVEVIDLFLERLAHIRATGHHAPHHAGGAFKICGGQALGHERGDIGYIGPCSDRKVSEYLSGHIKTHGVLFRTGKYHYTLFFVVTDRKTIVKRFCSSVDGKIVPLADRSTEQEVLPVHRLDRENLLSVFIKFEFSCKGGILIIFRVHLIQGVVIMTLSFYIFPPLVKIQHLNLLIPI